MSYKSKAKSLIARKLQDPEYRKRYEEEYVAFKLEVQILTAIEEKNWTYSDLAKATQTSRSNVSRDFKNGFYRCTLARLIKIADALDHYVLIYAIPKESKKFIVPKIEELIRDESSYRNVEIKPISAYDGEK